MPYSPEPARQKIMETLGVREVVTTQGRAAVESNPEGCVSEWMAGRSGSTMTMMGGINWSLMLLYVALFAAWWWWTSK